MKNTATTRFFKSPGSRMDSFIREAMSMLPPLSRRVFWALRKWSYAAPQSDVARHLHSMENGDIISICTLASLMGKKGMMIDEARARVREAITVLRHVRARPTRGIRPFGKEKEEWGKERLARAHGRVVGAWKEYRDSLRAAVDIAMSIAVREIRAFAGHGGLVSLDSSSDGESDDDDGYAWIGHAKARAREIDLRADLESIGLEIDDADMEEGRVSESVYARLCEDPSLARAVYARLGGSHSYARDSILRGAIRRASRK